MTRSDAIRVHPRTDADPVPDVMGMRLAHRAMLRDADRLTGLAERLATEPTADRKRADAVARYVRDIADSVHHHHSVEDEVLWPVLAASAGPHVDLTELSDDHAALDPALHRLRAAADAFRARPGEDTATALAVELAELRDTLTEHIGDEEAAVFPGIERYVSVADWAAVEARIRKRAKLSFEAPRVLAVATGAERATIEADGGLALKLILAVLVPPFRRRERAVFGA
jgi:hemerythrin-like domain-containing protein